AEREADTEDRGDDRRRPAPHRQSRPEDGQELEHEDRDREERGVDPEVGALVAGGPSALPGCDGGGRDADPCPRAEHREEERDRTEDDELRAERAIPVAAHGPSLRRVSRSVVEAMPADGRPRWPAAVLTVGEPRSAPYLGPDRYFTRFQTAPAPLRLPRRHVTTPTTTRPTTMNSASERTSDFSLARSSSRCCRSAASSLRMSSTVRSDMALECADGALCLFDRRCRLRRRGFAGEALGEESGDRGDEENDGCDDEERQPPRKHLAQAGSHRRESETDAVNSEDGGSDAQTAGDSNRSDFLLPLQLGELEVELNERLYPSLDGFRLCNEAAHGHRTYSECHLLATGRGGLGAPPFRSKGTPRRGSRPV